MREINLKPTITAYGHGGRQVYLPPRCISALIEVREVLSHHKKEAAERLNVITFLKDKAISFHLKEIPLSSHALILCEHLRTQYSSVTFFDALHASVALNNKLSIISNHQVYDDIKIERLSFPDFLKTLKT